MPFHMVMVEIGPQMSLHHGQMNPEKSPIKGSPYRWGLDGWLRQFNRSMSPEMGPDPSSMVR